MLSLNLHADHRAGWVEDTFLDREAAENALNGQYADFTSRDDIMDFVPTYIRPRIGFHEETRGSLASRTSSSTSIRE